VVAYDLYPPRDTDAASTRPRVSGLIPDDGGKDVAHRDNRARRTRIPAVSRSRTSPSSSRPTICLLIRRRDRRRSVNPSPANRRRVSREQRASRGGCCSSRCATCRAPARRHRSADAREHEVRGARRRGRVRRAGVGRFRTEYLFHDGDSCPTKSVTTRPRSRCSRKLNGKTATIRNVRFSARKVAKFHGARRSGRGGPGLPCARSGCASRARQGFGFRAQLRGLRARRQHGPLKIHVPDDSASRELRMVERRGDSVKADLRTEGIAFDDEQSRSHHESRCKASGAHADLSRERCDLSFSIGTNEFNPYTMPSTEVKSKCSDTLRAAASVVLRRSA